jgi:hypothetical protein
MKTENEKIHESTRYGILGLILLAGVFLAPYAWRSLRPFIIDPAAYYIWAIKKLLRVVPQSFFWLFLVGSLGLVSVIIIFRFLDLKADRQEEKLIQSGQVGSLAEVFFRSKKSHYNKWLVANRLANTTLETLGINSGEINGDNHALSKANWNPQEEVKQYIVAGLDTSKMSLQREHRLFKSIKTNPLNIDVNMIIDFIESEMESS